MNFLAPTAFVFAAAIPIIILFYLLKRKRVVRLVPSTLLWQRFLAETQASAPFQKLRRNWLLFLQILLVLLAVLALTRPYFAGVTRGGRLQIVILDASASMLSRDVEPDRFKKAQEQALALVDGLRDDSRMVVIQAGARTKVMQSATSEKSVLRRAINATAADDTPTRLTEALKLAENLIKNQFNPEIHIFSDGRVEDLSEFENSKLPLIYHPIGERAANLGIVNLDVRTHPEDPSLRAIFASIANYSASEQEAPLELRFGGQLVSAKNVTVPPGELEPVVFTSAQEEDGIFHLRLLTDDDLSVDNEASVVSMLAKQVRVHLVTSGNRFMEKALRAAPRLELSVGGDYATGSVEADIIVLDGVVPTQWPEANMLAFRVARTGWFSPLSELTNPALVSWRDAHPLLRFVDFDNVQVGEALGTSVPVWGVGLLEAPRHALMVAGEIDQRRVVWVGFDTLDSTWPLRVSFPIFLSNAMEWLNPALVNANRLNLKAGDPLHLTLDDPVETAQVTLPDGEQRDLTLPEPSNSLVFGDTLMQGIYRIQAGTNHFAFAVNLMDGQESNTEPLEELSMGEYAVAAQATRTANLEIWRWFAMAGLVVLLGEWWYYHRRTA